MTVVHFATAASPHPMGQQAYETQVVAALEQLPSTEVQVERRVIRSLRSPLPGNVRLPMRQVERSPAAAALAAAWAYRGADLVHRCDLRLPPSRRPDREVVTVHDLAFALYDDEGTVPGYAVHAVARSRVVIAPSWYSAEELRERWGLSDVRVISNGVDPAFADAALLTDADRRALGAPGRFVVHSGGCTTRKNLPALAEAWQSLAPHLQDVTLVLSGPEDPRREALFRQLPRTSLVGRLPRDLQVRAVRAASAVVVPSVYEGFGLPAAEAMLAGTPVVAAARASLPEVCGDAGLLVEPTAQGLADGIDAVLTDDVLAQRLRAAGRLRASRFSWKQSARQHLDLYLEVAA